MAKWIASNQRTFKKTGSYYLTHIAVAITVAYAVTGDFASSLTLSLLEPSVQAVVYFVHERFWSSSRRDGDVLPQGELGIQGQA